MYKLLYKEANGDLTCRSDDFEKIFPTLYAYESTNLTPDCIKGLQGQVLRLSTTVLEQRETIDALQKELDRMTELWDVLPVHIQGQAIEIRNPMKGSEAKP